MLFSLDLIDKEDIYTTIKELSTTCSSCRLSLLHPHNRGLLYRGNPLAKIAVLAEAPGDQETEQGQPLVGKSGKEWENWAAQINLNTKTQVFHTNVIQCFPGHIKPEATNVKKVYRYKYNGPGRMIILSEGLHSSKANVLTGTSNHPVLTLRGWVSFNELIIGDYLIHGDFIGSLSSVGPNPHHTISTFDEIFRLLATQYPITRVIGNRSNFHGDGSDQNIDVITIDSKLGMDLNIPLPETFGNLPFIPTYKPSRSLSINSSGLSSILKRSDWLGLASRDLVSSLGELLPIRLSSKLISRLIPFGNSTNHSSKFNELLLNSLIADASLLSELLKANARQITIRQVIDIKEVKLSEHVYNLQTANNTYLANGIISHNCQPQKSMREGKMQQDPPDKDEIKACFVPRSLRVLKAMPNLECVITLGWVAAKAILGGEPKSKTHEGNWFESTALPGIAIFCMVHPSFILREPSPEKDLKVAECMRAFKREYLDSNKCWTIAQEIKKRRDGTNVFNNCW